MRSWKAPGGKSRAVKLCKALIVTKRCVNCSNWPTKTSPKWSFVQILHSNLYLCIHGDARCNQKLRNFSPGGKLVTCGCNCHTLLHYWPNMKITKHGVRVGDLYIRSITICDISMNSEMDPPSSFW